MRKHLVRWLPPVLVMGAIFYFSSRTGDELGSLMPFFHKLFPAMESFDWGHFVAYFILGLTFVWAIAGPNPTVRQRLLVVLLCTAYGLTDEFHQLFVSGRSSDWHDLRNDAIGGALAMLVLYIPFIARPYARLPHQMKE
jgi:hypothetical protein